MAAFWAVFTFGGSGPALTAHGSLDLKQEIQIQIQIQIPSKSVHCLCPNENGGCLYVIMMYITTVITNTFFSFIS
jgi:hypothetical protein